MLEFLAGAAVGGAAMYGLAHVKLNTIETNLKAFIAKVEADLSKKPATAPAAAATTAPAAAPGTAQV